MFSIERTGSGRYKKKEGKSSELFTVLKNSTDSQGLFISKLGLLGNADALDAANWFRNILLSDTVSEDHSISFSDKDKDIEVMRDPRFIDIFHLADYNICSVEINENNPYDDSVIIKNDDKGNESRRELRCDSTGVRDFFTWAVRIFRVVYEDKVLFADAMDRNLSPILSDRVIAFVNGSEHKGQLIFTTHNIFHLNLKTFMK